MDNSVDKISELVEQLKFFSKMADRHAFKGEDDFEFKQYHEKKEQLLQSLISETLKADIEPEDASNFIQKILEQFHKPILKNGKNSKLDLKEIYRQLAA